MAKVFDRLTRTNARKLEPGQSITEHGITLLRLPNGDGVYSVNVMVDGERIHRTLGRESEGVTRTQAEDFIAQARTDAKHDRLSLPRGRKATLSFREAADLYLKKLEQEAGRDIAGKRARLDLHLVPFFRDVPLAKIASFDVRRYKKHRLAEPSHRGGDRRSKDAAGAIGRPRAEVARRGDFTTSMTSEATVNRELAVLSQMLSKAVEWGWLTRRVAKIERFKESGRVVYLTVEQASRLVDAAAKDTNFDIHPFVVIGLSTSMRLTEILSIRRENVDTARRVIFIPKAKAGKREQPITAQLAAFLERHMGMLPKTTPWLFPSKRSKTGRVMNIKDPFRRVAVAAGLDPKQVTPHVLRHTAISHLVQAGVDLPTIKKVSGHKTLSMIDRYAHADGDHIQSAMDRLEGRLELPMADTITPKLHQPNRAAEANGLESRMAAGGPPGGRTRHQRIMSPLL